MDTKKERELWLLSEMKPTYPDFPQGAIECHEGPDFLVRQMGRVIGIELTYYIRGQGVQGSPVREKEKLGEMLLSKARIEFEQTHDVPLRVDFVGEFRPALAFPRVQSLASEIAQFVSIHIPIKLFDEAVLTVEDFEGTSLSEFAGLLHIRRMRNERQALWSFIRAGFTAVEPPELQKLISDKDAKVRDYLTHCDDVWLVIVAEAEAQYLSSHVSIDERLTSHSYSHKFGRVLLYDRVTQSTLTLSAGQDFKDS